MNPIDYDTPKLEYVDLEEIEIQEVTVSTYMGKPYMSVIGADVSEILETIGIDRVKEYFGIKEEEL